MYQKNIIYNRFDSRTIFLSSLLLFITVISSYNLKQIIFSFSLIFIHTMIIGIKLKHFIKVFIASIWLLLSIIFINYFLIGRDIDYIIVSLFKLSSIILLASVFLSSLSIMDIGFAIEKSLFFLSYIKIPINILSSVIVLSLKFIVLIKEETLRIQKAQKARGLDFKIIGLKGTIYNIINLFIPIIIFAIQSSIKTAIAMDIRGFSSHCKKTRLYESNMIFKDYFYLSFIIIGLTIYIYLYIKNI